MLDEPFMLFSGPCSAAEQGAGLLSPCSADASPEPPGSTRALAAAAAPPPGAPEGTNGSSNIIHVHPHTVSGARMGGSHFNAPSPPRRPRPAAIIIVEAEHDHLPQEEEQQDQDDVPCSRQQAEANQDSVRSDASSLEVDLPQRPATMRARGGAFNNFFFKRSGSSSVLSAMLASSGGTTPANGNASGSANGKKKKRAFPGFTPKGLGGVGFGSLSITPRHQQQDASAERGGGGGGGGGGGPSSSSGVSGSGGKDAGGSPIFGGLTRGASLMNL